MTEDYVVGVVVEFAQGNKSVALFYFAGARNVEALRVRKDAGRFLLDQDTLLAPCAEVTRRARINAFPTLGIEEFRQAEDDAHQVIRAALVISLLHRRGDLVVGLRHYVVQPDSGRIVSPGAERI